MTIVGELRKTRQILQMLSCALLAKTETVNRDYNTEEHNMALVNFPDEEGRSMELPGDIFWPKWPK